MASNAPGACCAIGSLFEGEPKGQMTTIGNNINAYVTKAPADKERKGCGVLFLTDVIGIWQNSKLVADSFAANGYTTLVPDLFYGDAVPLNRPGDFDLVKWLRHGLSAGGGNPHTPEAVDPLVVEGIKALRDMGITSIASVGYCFGAKYVVRHYKSGINCGYLAHPSFVDEAELEAITGPISIAAAEIDNIFPADKRHKSEEILAKVKQPYQINLYGGVEHGFAIRGSLDNQVQRFAKEQALRQALAWFDVFLESP